MSMTHGAVKKDDMSTNSAIANAALTIKNIDRNRNSSILSFIFGLPFLEI